MRVFRSLDELERDRAAVAGGTLSVGNFDGVHLGHQRILARAAELARPVAVMTFDPHPLAVLNPAQAPPVMTPTPYRLELLAAAGVDAALVVSTDRELLAMEPEQFVEQVVVARFAPRAMVEGPNFGFGRGRRGDIDLLRGLGRRFGFDVQVVEQVARPLPGHSSPRPISSTLVRRLISGGNVEAARACLGRPYRLIGEPTSGAGRGRRIGFPTVNLAPGGQLLPADGVYAAVADCEPHRGPAAVNIGPSPTFGRDESVVEAHLLDFEGTLECERLSLDLLARLRGVEKFDSPEALAEQIGRDVADTRRIAADR
jgi:riboflavin kinase/FMN adenylyltransferase